MVISRAGIDEVRAACLGAGKSDASRPGACEEPLAAGCLDGRGEHDVLCDHALGVTSMLISSDARSTSSLPLRD